MRKVKFKKFNGVWSDYVHDGVFHQWANGYEQFEAGPANYTYALIELPDGTVEEVLPCNVRFENGSVWNSVDIPPTESGRYWCYIEEVTDLGLSHYQWNCSYNVGENRWGGEALSGRVTHWMPLPEPPKFVTPCNTSV